MICKQDSGSPLPRTLASFSEAVFVGEGQGVREPNAPQKDKSPTTIHKKITMSPLRYFNARLQHAFLAAATFTLTIGMQDIVSAHPGHGITPDGDAPVHYLVEPSHGISVALALVASIAVAYIVRSRVIASRG